MSEDCSNSSDDPQSTSADDCLTAVFEALSHPHRRHILLALTDDSSAAVIQDPFDIVITDVDPDILVIQLYHNHLPKLDDFGFIDWDQGSETVTRGDRFGDIEPLLELLNQHKEILPYEWPGVV
jgi:hypothetical protein